MKPYPGHKPTASSPERIFNYRLSKARRIIENIFGTLSAKFRVLLKPIALYRDKVESVVLSCIYLHNFLRINSVSRGFYTPPGLFDLEVADGNYVPGLWRSEVDDTNSLLDPQNISKRISTVVHTIRHEFRDYNLSPEGAVPWLNDIP
jgi:hypothetical protein